VFQNETKLEEHANLAEICPQGEKKLAAGFDKEQEKLLRSKSKKDFDSSASPDAAWRHIYRILFPDDVGRIPDPCKFS
jgi:hypothetical protein